MSKRMKLAFALAAAAAGGAALLMSACESVPLTAAPGTEMTLTANPPFVIANGGVSVVTAILVEPAGTFVPDGTEIFCFTNLGRVDSSGKTRNGVARVNFVSDARSGRATVSCQSGGPAPAPTASPSPTPTPGQGLEFGASGAGTPRVVAAVGVATAENSASVEITIGSALPARVLVTASPAVLANNRRATIAANVFDEFGNPVQNVPVIFSITASTDPTTPAQPAQEVLESGGAPRYTDANGQAFDTLISRSLTGTAQRRVTVTATTANGMEGSVVVTVSYTAVAP